MPMPDPLEQSVWIELSRIDLRNDARPHSAEETKKLAESMKATAAIWKPSGQN